MIVVDIGNTTLHFAWVRCGQILKTKRIPVQGAILSAIKKNLSDRFRQDLLICSVVPEITALFKKLRKRVYVVGEQVKVPLESHYNKKQIGMDRLVGAYAAKIFFPDTRMILDFGTAITLDFLSKKGHYQGGLILPGVGSTLQVLSGCALLPKNIRFAGTKKIIPTDTMESISKGLQDGFSLMINGLVENYRRLLKINNSAKIIITGGQAPFILAKLDFSYHYEPDLVLRGLAALGQNISLA